MTRLDPDFQPPGDHHAAQVQVSARQRRLPPFECLLAKTSRQVNRVNLETLEPGMILIQF